MGSKMGSPFYRKVDCNYIYKSLKEEQKTFAEAGTNSRKCWTPFQSTVRSITETVTSNNGIEFKDLIKKISHHYSSYSAAKNSLTKWIECGVIKGVVLKEDGGLLKCYLDNSNRDLKTSPMSCLTDCAIASHHTEWLNKYNN